MYKERYENFPAARRVNSAVFGNVHGGPNIVLPFSVSFLLCVSSWPIVWDLLLACYLLLVPSLLLRFFDAHADTGTDTGTD